MRIKIMWIMCNLPRYEDFLESRCLPRPRDRIKLELKELDIPFYDPYLIIKKNAGANGRRSIIK